MNTIDYLVLIGLPLLSLGGIVMFLLNVRITRKIQSSRERLAYLQGQLDKLKGKQDG